MQDPMETFVVNLMKAKGEPDSAEVRASLLKNVNDAIDQALIEALPSEQFAKLEKATDEKTVDGDLIEKLLQEAGVIPEEVIKNELTKFRDEYLKGAK